MKFEFYHGTSDVFLKSIQENGLGGLNPNIEYKHLEILQFLFKLAEIHLVESSDYSKIRDTTKAMSQQRKLKVTNENGKSELYNFNHDGIYIALSLERAVCYASQNKYGSEIVDRIIRLMDLLDIKKIKYSNSALPIDKLNQLRKTTPKPIIIKIKEIDEDKLDKEDGKTGKEALEFLQKIHHELSEKDRFKFYQICNFKLLEPIHPNKLEYFELDYEGIFGHYGFEYTMTKIR